LRQLNRAGVARTVSHGDKLLIPQALDADQLSGLVAVARGRKPAEIVITGGRVVNVYSEEVYEADVVISSGRIAYVGSQLDAIGDSTEVIDAAGAFILPGYIEPHCHPWALYNPDSLARYVLPWGNTAYVGELLNLQLLLDPSQMLQVYRDLEQSFVRWFWAIRVAGQSRQDLLSHFPLGSIEQLLAAPGVVEIAEITAWPQVLAGDMELFERMALAKHHGLRVDGHAAGATAEKITALAAAGFTADHESIDLEEAGAKLRNGYHVILRNSSLRPDLDALIPLIKDGRGSSRLSVTSDGSGPAWIGSQGMVDGIVRRLVRAGVPIPRAVALASLNPATYFRLDEHLGGLAPGRCADLQVLSSFDGEPPEVVMVGGRVVARSGHLVESWKPWEWQRYLDISAEVDLDLVGDPASYSSPTAPYESVRTMQFISAGIARAGQATAGKSGWPDGCVLAVLFARDGRRKSWAWMANFAPGLEGLATSYTTSADYLVIGTDPVAMAMAAREAFSGAGGIAVVESGRVVASMELDIAGSMSSRPLEDVIESWERIDAAVRRGGYPFEELLFCLCFVTCDFLPDLRLVADGLLEVKTNRIIVPAQILESRH